MLLPNCHFKMIEETYCPAIHLLIIANWLWYKWKIQMQYSMDKKTLYKTNKIYLRFQPVLFNWYIYKKICIWKNCIFEILVLLLGIPPIPLKSPLLSMCNFNHLKLFCLNFIYEQLYRILTCTERFVMFVHTRVHWFPDRCCVVLKHVLLISATGQICPFILNLCKIIIMEKKN